MASSKVRLDDGGYTVRWCARRKEAKIFPVAVHQIDETRMIHGVLGGALNRDLGEIHPVRARGIPDMLGIASEPDQARMEERHIVGKMRGRVAFGIDGDKQRLHPVAVRAELVD